MRLYKVLALSAGHPQSVHTVGSTMWCRTTAYCQVGGMPLKKAGEDFYFIHKFSKRERLGSLDKVLVYPSSRSSDRVPFGTGRAVLNFQSRSIQYSYNLKSYERLKEWIEFLKGSWLEVELEKLCEENFSFYSEYNFRIIIEDVIKNSSSQAAFQKRLFQKFDAFFLMKYMHFMRLYFKDENVILIAQNYLKNNESPQELLSQIRKIDNSN